MNERKQTAKAATKSGIGSGHSSPLEDALLLTLQNLSSLKYNHCFMSLSPFDGWKKRN